MLLQKSPNRWSCLPTAFAIILDMDVKELIAAIGHDGSEIIAPNLPEPLCRRTFHSQEIIDVLWYKGFAVTMIERFPSLLTDEGQEPLIINGDDSRIEKAIQGQRAVLSGITYTGSRHAVAYSKGNMYCPSGGWIKEESFTTYIAYILCPRGWMIAPE